MLVICVIGIIKGIIKSIIGGIISFVIMVLCGLAWYNNVQTPQQFINMVQEVLPKSAKVNNRDVGDAGKIADTMVDTAKGAASGAASALAGNVEKLLGDVKSSTTEGSVNYGATFVMGDLDHLKRATYAHIRVKDSQEPGSNGIKRPERITTNPAGWNNKNGTNDRTHLVGYQFSGVNSDPRNLVTATAYLNRGVEKKGSDDKNPDGMLFYEQKLDAWMKQNPKHALDLYVAPNYDGDNLVPTSITMRWVGVTDDGQLIKIPTGGYATEDGDIMTVTLQNTLKNK